METPAASCQITAWVRRRHHSHRVERLMTAGILWASILGCSQDGSSITIAMPCAAPVTERSGSMLGTVGSPDAGPDGNRSRVTLKWDAGSNTFGYRLYIGTSSQSYQQVADVGRLTKSVVSNLAGHMTYYFVVTAYNSAGESCPSNEVSVPAVRRSAASQAAPPQNIDYKSPCLI